MPDRTPYGDVNALLADWVAGADRALGRARVGLYLTGSLSYRAFVPGRSDVDLLAVVERPLTARALAAVERLHENLDRRHPAWAGRTECAYLPQGLLGETLPPAMPRPWWGFGVLHPAAPYGNEWLIDNYLLYHHAVALRGPAFRTLLAPIDVAEVRRASAHDFVEEWLAKRGDRAYLADPHRQSYLVLTLCRVLYAVEGGRLGSKQAAAGWVKRAHPQWVGLVEEAERWAYGRAMARREEAIAFIRFAAEVVNRSGLLTP